MTTEQLRLLQLQRSLTYMFRGEPMASQRLRRLRRGAPPQPPRPPATSETLETLLAYDAGLREQLRYWNIGVSTKEGYACV